MLTWRFAVRLNRSLVELVGLVIEKIKVVNLKSFPCVIVKKTFQVTCGVASFQIHKMKLILFCRVPASSPKDIDDFTNCPTHRSNLGVEWSRGSHSRCRVPKELSGHGKGRVKSIPKANRGNWQASTRDRTQDVWKIRSIWLR